MSRPITHQQYLTTSHYASLDGIRCISIMMVLCGHVYAQSLDSSATIQNLVVGVDIFFVLSGFLITTLILKELRLTTTFNFKKFFIRRILRIFPAYYFLIFLLCGAGLIAGSEVGWARHFFEELPWHATFLSNVIVSKTALEISWSLSTEEQFYLVWPLIISLWHERMALIVLVLFTFLNISFLFSGADALFSIKEYHLAQTTFFPLCSGCLLAYLMNNMSTFNYMQYILKSRICFMFVLGIITILLLCWSSEWSGPLRIVFDLLITALIAACIIEPTHLLSTILNFPLFSRIGKISYGIYLFHGIAINIFRPLLWPLSTVLIMSVMSSILFAELSYRCIESPLLRLKTKIAP